MVDRRKTINPEASRLSRVSSLDRKKCFETAKGVVLAPPKKCLPCYGNGNELDKNCLDDLDEVFLCVCVCVCVWECKAEPMPPKTKEEEDDYQYKHTEENQ